MSGAATPVTDSIAALEAASPGVVPGAVGVLAVGGDVVASCTTAADLLSFAREFMSQNPRILSADSVIAMTANLNSNLPDDAHGVGFEIDQLRYMGELSGPRTVGRTGFTGTSLVADLERDAVAILLTNAVHPHRPDASINPVRAAWATGLARSLR